MSARRTTEKLGLKGTSKGQTSPSLSPKAGSPRARASLTDVAEFDLRALRSPGSLFFITPVIRKFFLTSKLSLSCCDLSLVFFFFFLLLFFSPLPQTRSEDCVLLCACRVQFSPPSGWGFQFFQALTAGNGSSASSCSPCSPLGWIQLHHISSHFPSPQHHDIADSHSAFDPFPEELLVNPTLGA